MKKNLLATITAAAIVALTLLSTSFIPSSYAASVNALSSEILPYKGPRSETLLCYVTNGLPTVGILVSSTGSGSAQTYKIKKFRGSVYKTPQSAKKFKSVNAKASRYCTKLVVGNPQKYSAAPSTGSANGVTATATPTRTATPTPLQYDGLSPVAAFMYKPFVGDYEATRWFDHRLFQGAPATPAPNWAMVYSGELSSDLTLNAANYQFKTNGGTTISSVAAGTVSGVSSSVTERCDDGIREYLTYSVRILHKLSPTIAFTTEYSSLAQLQVGIGQAVGAGQVIGATGFVGCTTSESLTFSVKRLSQKTNTYPVDPYGWVGSFADPFFVSSGISLNQLWLPGQAPGLFRERVLDTATFSTPTLIKARFMGTRDDIVPNNEFIEVGIGGLSPVPSLDLAGYKIKINGTRDYVLPANSIATVATPIRIYIGSPSPDLSGQFIGSASPLLGSALRDFCVQLYRPDNTRVGNKIGSQAGCL